MQKYELINIKGGSYFAQRLNEFFNYIRIKMKFFVAKII